MVDSRVDIDDARDIILNDLRIYDSYIVLRIFVSSLKLIFSNGTGEMRIIPCI